MIRTTCEHDYFFALFFSLCDYFIALCLDLASVVVLLLIRLFGGDANLIEREVREVERKPLVSLSGEVLGAVDTEVLLDKVYLFDILHVVLDHLGVVGYNGTVVVVVAEVLVKVI